MSSHTHVLLAALAVVAACPAQSVQVTHKSSGYISCHAAILRNQRNVTTPPDTNLVPGHTVEARHVFGWPVGAYYTDTSVSPGRIVVRSALVAYCPGSAYSAGGSAPTLLTFKSTQPVSALLRVTISSFASDARQSWGAKVDIGRTNVTKLTARLGQRVVHEALVRIDSTGLPIAMRTSVSAIAVASAASAQGNVEVELVPVATAAAYGNRCASGTPTLEGVPRFDGQVDFALKSRSPSSIGNYWIGSRVLSLRIPGTACWLNTDILLAIPFVTDANGEHRARWPVPAKVQLNVQGVLATRANSAVTTNGVRVVGR